MGKSGTYRFVVKRTEATRHGLRYLGFEVVLQERVKAGIRKHEWLSVSRLGSDPYYIDPKVRERHIANIKKRLLELAYQSETEMTISSPFQLGRSSGTGEVYESRTYADLL